ncbi:hypothetical protein M3J09_006380 [Ascochyta lentis]
MAWPNVCHERISMLLQKYTHSRPFSEADRSMCRSHRDWEMFTKGSSSLRRSLIACGRSHLHATHHTLMWWGLRYRFAGTPTRCLCFGSSTCAVSATSGSNGLPVLPLSQSGKRRWGNST